MPDNCIRRKGTFTLRIDVHSHVWLREHLSSAFIRDMGRAYGGGLPPERLVHVPPEAHLRAMEAVERCVVFGLRSRRLGLAVPNSFVAEYAAAHSDRVVGFACVDPNEEDAPGQLDEAVAMGLRGLKLAPIYQYFHPHAPEAGRIYRRAAAHGLPVLWHQGTTFTETGPLEVANPLLLERVALEFPELTQIIAHLGHPWHAETIVLIRKHPRLFADISALHYRPWQFYNMLVLAQEYGVVDRLLLGSDFPFTTPADTIAALVHVNDLIEGTALPRVRPDTVAGIIERNAAAALADILGR